MELGKSLEDYLETILILQSKTGNVHSVHVANHMGFSKPSVSHATKELRKKGYLTMNKGGNLYFTEQGRFLAEKVYERHVFFKNMLIEAGVEPELAERDGCQIEHALSDESFRKLKQAWIKKTEKS